jgi:hypothetical protein
MNSNFKPDLITFCKVIICFVFAGSGIYIESSDEPISKVVDDTSARNEPPQEEES